MKKPRRILILDNNREENSFGSKDLVHWSLKCAPKGSEVWVRRAPDLDIPHDLEFDALVLSGSVTSCLEQSEAWISPYDAFVTHHLGLGTPTLGVCYGHQTIARCLYRMHGQEPKLAKAEHPEFGWCKIDLVAESPLFTGLPTHFITFESHYEEVSELPPGTIRVAKNDRCAIQSYQVEGKPIFGIQFHPEYTIEDGEASMSAKLKKGVPREWIFNVGNGPKVYDEKVPTTTFSNFFSMVNPSER